MLQSLTDIGQGKIILLIHGAGTHKKGLLPLFAVRQSTLLLRQPELLCHGGRQQGGNLFAGKKTLPQQRG